MPGTRIKERRKSPRHRFCVPVQLVTSARLKPISVETLDISEGGVFIPTDSPLPEATEVTLVFYLSNLNASVRATGTVTRATEDSEAGGGPAGMAIEFDGDGKLGWHLLQKLFDSAEAEDTAGADTGDSEA